MCPHGCRDILVLFADNTETVLTPSFTYRNNATLKTSNIYRSCYVTTVCAGKGRIGTCSNLSTHMRTSKASLDVAFEAKDDVYQMGMELAMTAEPEKVGCQRTSSQRLGEGRFERSSPIFKACITLPLPRTSLFKQDYHRSFNRA